jgi:hypothetical protein
LVHFTDEIAFCPPYVELPCFLGRKKTGDVFRTWTVLAVLILAVPVPSIGDWSVCDAELIYRAQVGVAEASSRVED